MPITDNAVFTILFGFVVDFTFLYVIMKCDRWHILDKRPICIAADGSAAMEFKRFPSPCSVEWES